MTTRTAIPELRRDAAPVVRARGERSGRFFFFLALGFAALTALAEQARGYELRLSTENDLFVEEKHPDDLYTFSVGIGVDRGPYTFGLQEHAFTDRQANVRFDETHLTVTRRLTRAAWQVELTGGAVHVGHGLFGEEAQNAVHDLIGADEVDLRYADSDLHPEAAVSAERWWPLGRRIVAGPRIEAAAVPGLHSHAIVAGQLAWQANRWLDVELLAGHRFTDTDHEALEGRLASEAPIGVVSVVLVQRLEVTWSFNKLGDEREHLTVGYRVRGPRVGWIGDADAREDP